MDYKIDDGQTLEEYGELVKGKKCRFCNTDLPTKVEHRDHSDGWKVKGIAVLQWLWVTCTKCKHEWSLWKLEVFR